jgi:hypothetical protein
MQNKLLSVSKGVWIIQHQDNHKAHSGLSLFHFVMHPKWQALQSKFGITCDMFIENTSKLEASSHFCHDNA